MSHKMAAFTNAAVRSSEPALHVIWGSSIGGSEELHRLGYIAGSEDVVNIPPETSICFQQTTSTRLCFPQYRILRHVIVSSGGNGHVAMCPMKLRHFLFNCSDVISHVTLSFVLGHAVALCVDKPCHKAEGPCFDSRSGHWVSKLS
jgi:hypothetical protein